MKNWKKRFWALLTALCLVPALPARASQDGFFLEWRENGAECTELRLMGLEQKVYAVQLELTLDGSCEDLEFIPEAEEAYAPECGIQTVDGKTGVTLYLVSREPLNQGNRLSLGTLESTRVLPAPERVLLTLLGRDLKPIRGANGTPIDLWGRWAEEEGTTVRGYRILLEQPEHGTIRANPMWAEEGETVTVTVKPDAGYSLDRLEVIQTGGRRVNFRDLGGNRFRFTMPDGQVTVSAVLVQGGEGLWDLPFTDVSPEDWFYEAAGYVYTRGLMLGTTATAFSPNVTTNRGMIVTILHRLEGEPTAPAQGSFTDVPPEMYCAAAVDWAASYGIVGGYGNGTFGPRDTITRQQLAAILYRYAAYKNYPTEIRESLGEYPDSAAISSYAWDAMGWAVGNGLLLTDPEGMLQPQSGATRAQAAFALTGLCLDVAAEDGE